MPESTSIDRFDRDAFRAAPDAGLRAGTRRRPWLLATLTAALTILAGAALAQDAVTPDALAEQVPATWSGLPVAETLGGIDASGAAFASAHYDHEDGRSYRDLSLGITDLGPYRDAVLLVHEADVAEGRLERLEISGHPAFAAEERGDPELAVIAGRMWIRSSSFGELFGADDLRAAVESLQVDEIAALSDLPTAPGASYSPIGFTRGALRSFLPEAVLGVPRVDGFYAEVHPTGVAWGGFPYVGERDGDEVRLKVGIWDLGTIADAARERLAGAPEAWRPFTEDGRQGYVEVDVDSPRVMLFAGRFRVQVEVLGNSDVDTAWLRGAFASIDLERLERLAELVSAPTPARDPLQGQPKLIDPQRLAEAVPEELAGRSRGDVRAEVQTDYSDPFDTALVRVYYPEDDGEPELRLEIRDQGLLTYEVQQDLAEMSAAEVGGRTVWTNDRQSTVAILVGDRVLVELQTRGEESAGDLDALAATLVELDVTSLQAAADGAD